MTSEYSADGKTLVFSGASIRPPSRKHESTVFGYPTEDGSEIRFAVACRCGFNLAELATEEEAKVHEREHYLPGYSKPFASEILYTSKGEEVETRMTDREAAEVLVRESARRISIGRPSEFVSDLAKGFAKYESWTKGQRPWAHKLANEVLDREKAPETFDEIGRKADAPDAVSQRFERIVEMLTRAGRTLKYPKVVVEFDEGAIALSLSGGRARFPGSVNVTTPGSFESRTWFGRIHPDGRFEGSRRGAPDWVVDALVALDEDPAGVAAAQGQRYGSCCFCRRELTTKESLAVGYGPVCADKYGLPWGDVPEPENPNRED